MLKRLERHVELGELEEIEEFARLPHVPRYVVTHMNSQTGERIRSATIVTVTNQSPRHNVVSVSYFGDFRGSRHPSGGRSCAMLTRCNPARRQPET